MTKVCIFGLGYIGLPTAAMFAANGVEVIGIDINDKIIHTLINGGIHIQEYGLAAIVKQSIESGFLKPTFEPEPADAFIIAVPTPFYEDKRADMRAVAAAAEAIVPHLRKGNLVILESTSPPLTTINLLKPILEKSGLTAGKDFHLAYSPERVLPGQILKELVNNARVIGGIDIASAKAGQNLYATFVKGDIVLTDATTAEMVKLMENTYRDINIAVANEFSRLAERFGIDVWEAIRIANLHPRVKILNPGPGVGGHCISVDPWFLVEAAPDLTSLIHSARQVNDSQPAYVVRLVLKALGESLSNKKIAALGLTYKQDVDDLRESPAVETARLLAKHGVRVVAFEPYRPDAQFEGFETSGSLEGALVDADLILILVGHKQFQELTPDYVKQISHARMIVDSVNIFPISIWQSAGFRLIRLGVGKS